MFIISQLLINKIVPLDKNKLLYALVLGIVIYGGVYLYILYQESSALSILNKFVHYIIIFDLLLSGLYYYKFNHVDENLKEDFNISLTEHKTDESGYESDNESGNESDDISSTIQSELNHDITDVTDTNGLLDTNENELSNTTGIPDSFILNLLNANQIQENVLVESSIQEIVEPEIAPIEQENTPPIEQENTPPIKQENTPPIKQENTHPIEQKMETPKKIKKQRKKNIKLC